MAQSWGIVMLTGCTVKSQWRADLYSRRTYSFFHTGSRHLSSSLQLSRRSLSVGATPKAKKSRSKLQAIPGGKRRAKSHSPGRTPMKSPPPAAKVAKKKPAAATKKPKSPVSKKAKAAPAKKKTAAKTKSPATKTKSPAEKVKAAKKGKKGSK